MLPVLEGLLRGSIEAKQSIEEIDSEFSDLTQQVFISGGTLVDVRYYAKRKAEREKSMQKAKDSLAEINAIGVQVKDLDMGLLDFPCNVGGEIVLLCWKLGEQAVEYWHEVDAGYSGRLPLEPSAIAAARPRGAA